MIAQQGRVLSTDGSVARIRVGSTSGCAACDAGEGCGAGVFARLLQRRAVEITVDNSLDAQAGRAVILGIPETVFLSLAVRLYGIPLAAGLVGAVISYQAMNVYAVAPLALDLATLAGGGLAAVLVFRTCARSLNRSVKPNSGPEGLYSEICMLEVKT